MRPIEPNCLAILIRAADPRNQHKLVRVVASQRGGTIPAEFVVCTGAANRANTAWLVETLGTAFHLTTFDSSHAVARTSSLRRLDDQPGTDEMLKRVGHPPMDDARFRTLMKEALVEISVKRQRGDHPWPSCD